MKRTTAMAFVLLTLCSCVFHPDHDDDAGREKSMDELKADIAKAEEDIRRYDEQITLLESQIARMDEQFGEDDPAAAELRNALEEVKAAKRKRSEELERMKAELACEGVRR